LRVPRTRDGEFSTELFQRYQRSEQALVLALMEMVVNGVSTRKITQITEELCGTSFSKSTVSSLCKGLDPMIQDWNDRSLHEHVYPFVLVDAIYTKVREDGRVRSRAVLIATGVNEEGYREILGLQIGNSESESSWSEFFGWLKDRGLRGVDLIISDQHGGLVEISDSLRIRACYDIAVFIHYIDMLFYNGTNFICNLLCTLSRK
jgi:putative transposase